jgi:hypothetical protein
VVAAAAAPALAADEAPWAYRGILDFKLPILAALIVFAGMVVFMIGVAKRNPNLYIRPLAGITAIEEAIGRATEMGRPVIYIPGVDDINNIQTIYSMVILEKVATMVAKYGTPLLVPTASAFVTPVAEETVKQGYLNAGVPENFNQQHPLHVERAVRVHGGDERDDPADAPRRGPSGWASAESLPAAETGFRAGAIRSRGPRTSTSSCSSVACDYTLIGEGPSSRRRTREPGPPGRSRRRTTSR